MTFVLVFVLNLNKDLEKKKNKTNVHTEKVFLAEGGAETDLTYDWWKLGLNSDILSAPSIF